METLYAPIISYAIYRECTPEWEMPRQKLQACDITYVLKGSAEYLINNVKYEVTAGDLLCMPQGSIRQGHTFPENLMTCYAVNFALTNPNGEDTTLPFPVLSHIGYKQELENLFRLFFYAWQEQQPGYLLETGGLFMLILHRLFELIVHNYDSTATDPRIKKVTQHILQHYAEKITVKILAAMAKLNIAYFGSLFKQETGLTVNQYLKKIRISNAINFLRSGEYTVTEVAALCGYSEASHFHHQFKAVTGVPPAEYFPRNLK
jgi:AraC-like DNA-binding protein